MNYLLPKRLPAACELAVWENEGGGLSAGESVGPPQDQAALENRGPLEVNELARVTLDSIADADLVPGHAVSLSISIGFSVYPDDGTDLRTLVQKADWSMFEGRKESLLNPVFLPGAS